jgi:hypothetical protein
MAEVTKAQIFECMMLIRHDLEEIKQDLSDLKLQPSFPRKREPSTNPRDSRLRENDE